MQNDPNLARLCLKTLDSIVKGEQAATSPILGANEAIYWLQEMGVTIGAEDPNKSLIEFAKRSGSMPWSVFKSNFDFHLASGCASSFVELARWCEVMQIYPLSPRQSHLLSTDSSESYSLIQSRIAACERLLNCSLQRLGFGSFQFFRMQFLSLEEFNSIGAVFRFVRQYKLEPPPRKADRWYFCNSIVQKFRDDLKQMSFEMIHTAIRHDEIPPGWERRQSSPSSPVNSLHSLRVWLERVLSPIQMAISLNREAETQQAMFDAALILRNAQRVCRWLNEHQTADSINVAPDTLLNAEQEILALILALPEPLLRMLTTNGHASSEGKPIPAIQLQGRNMPPIVNGKKAQKKLTETQFKVVSTLLTAFPGSLLMDDLERQSGCDNAVKIIANLRKYPLWSNAIVTPGKGNQGTGYSIAEDTSWYDDI